MYREKEAKNALSVLLNTIYQERVPQKIIKIVVDKIDVSNSKYEQQAKDALDVYLATINKFQSSKNIVNVIPVKSNTLNSEYESAAQKALKSYMEDVSKPKVIRKIVKVVSDVADVSNSKYEKQAKSELEKYLAANYTPDTVTNIVKIAVENPLNSPSVSDEGVKTALSQFLEENKQTQVVVVDSSADCSDCKDKCSEKIEETVFEFHYKIQKLYDNVHMRTSYFGRNVRNDVGASQIDSVAVTLDEYDIFFRLCKEAAANVYTILSANSGDLDKAFVFNAESNGKITYLISKRKRSFNFNLALALEILIETAIIYYILAKWFEIISMNSEAQKYVINYSDTVLNIQEKIRNLKMKKATRRYRFM